MFDSPTAQTDVKEVSFREQPERRRMTPQTIKVACSNCNLRELCMPVGLSPSDLDKIDEVVAVRR